MLKEIVTVPNEILKKISDPIEKVGINEKKLIETYLKQSTTPRELVLLQFKWVY